MWFNSMQREEPYLALTSAELGRNALVPSGIARQVLHGWSTEEEGGIPGVAVKCVDIGRNISGEGGPLVQY